MNYSDMTVGNPTRDIIRFALPLIGGYILQQMYLIIDAAIVGRWMGVGALAAVGASSSIMFLTMGFCNGVCAGFAIPVAQSFGAKDYVRMRSFVANAMLLCAIIAIIITILTAVYCDKILEIVNTPADIFHDAYVFLLINFIAIPFTMGYNMLAGFIRALGNSKQPFYILIVASLVNIVLDVVLIVIMRLGVEGAGIATLLSQAISCVIAGTYILRKMKMLIPQGNEREYNRDQARLLLSCGVPMGLQFSITGIGSIMLQSANNSLGTVYVAAFTASMRIKYLFTCVFENIGVAMATYCGQNVGAGKIDRISEGLRSALKIMAVYFVITFIVIMPFSDYMMLLFASSSEKVIIENASLFMRISCCFYPILGVLTILRYSIQGMGYSTLSMMSGVMEMLARCAVSIWLVPVFKFHGVCFGDPFAWCAADLFLIPAMLTLLHRMKKAE